MSLQDKKPYHDIEFDNVSDVPAESNSTTAEKPMYNHYPGLALTDFITFPIPIADIANILDSEHATADARPEQPRRRSFMEKLHFTHHSPKGEKFKMVRMTREEYFKYWAKDESGRYVGTEPEGQGKERIKKGVEDGTIFFSQDNKEPRKTPGAKDYLSPGNLLGALGVAATGGGVA